VAEPARPHSICHRTLRWRSIVGVDRQTNCAVGTWPRKSFPFRLSRRSNAVAPNGNASIIRQIVALYQEMQRRRLRYRRNTPPYVGGNTNANENWVEMRKSEQSLVPRLFADRVFRPVCVIPHSIERKFA